MSCYNNQQVQNVFEEILFDACTRGNGVKLVKILAPLTYQHGSNLISEAVLQGKLNIVKILASLSENPMNPSMVDNDGDTPIHFAAGDHAHGNGVEPIEIVRFLASLTTLSLIHI